MSEITNQEGNASAIIAVARDAEKRANEMREVDPAKDYVAFGTAPQIVDLEKLREHPDRPRGMVRPATVESLIDYVDIHKVDGATTIWVHETEGRVLVILDDHSAKTPAWREHRAELTLRHSAEWQYWTRQDGQLMGQTAFAEHLQEGLPDIIRPDGATLLEVAEKFQASTDVKFRSGVDRTSGEVKFLYDESIEAKATTAEGDIAVPKKFTLKLAPFIGEEAVGINANLRYSAKGGTLSLGYKLERPERIVEEALESVAEQLADKFDRVYRGTPA